MVAGDEVERLRELLRRWLRMRKEVLTPEELAQLYEDTRRELGIDHTDD